MTRRSPWWSGFLLWEYAPRIRDIEIYVVDKLSKDPNFSKLGPATFFPGGNAELEDGDSDLRTGVRELWQEMSLRPKLDAIPVEVAKEYVTHDHYRIWYGLLVSECFGQVRTEPLEEGSSVLSAPYKVKVPELLDVIHPNHLPPLKKNIERWRDFYQIPE